MAKKAKKLAKYSDLQEQLGNELPINAARLKFIVLLITALIKVQSVNFERLAQGFDNEVKLSSNLRRIQRFFAEFDLSSDLIAQLLFKLLPFCGPYRLTLDRTNWKYGQTNINILGCTTAALHYMADWLEERGVTAFAMESTGHYWYSVYDVLTRRGKIDVLLVNGRYSKNISGRKSDLLDCEWLYKLHSFGVMPTKRMGLTYLRYRAWVENVLCR